jgi:flagellar motor switch protein FliN
MDEDMELDETVGPTGPAQGMKFDGDSLAAMSLLNDIELDATLQFGSRELSLREVLELGPGDVVELDRHISEPVDLVVGDRIVARGEVVVASGNFALRNYGSGGAATSFGEHPMPVLDRFTSRSATGNSEVSGWSKTPSGRDRDTGRNSSLVGPALICGAPGCTSGWMKPWKNRRRPVFEDDWGCGGKCLDTLVSAAVRRETHGAGTDAETPHRHRVPLGLVLLAQGWITHPQLQTALAAQRASGEGRIGDWLMRSCGLPEERIARGLGVQWNCPVLSLDGFSPQAMALVMPKRFISEFGLVPVRLAGSSILYLAFQETMKAAAALGLEQMTGLKVESGLLTTTQLELAGERVLAAESVPVRIRLMQDADGMKAAIVKLLEQKQPVASRLVRMHQYFWMRMWMEERALQAAGGLPASTEDVEDHIFMLV